ncbi:MAG: discoidin domain-containing protein [Reichenbachiella sp.]
MKLLNTLKVALLAVTIIAGTVSAQEFELVSGNATATASTTESYLYEASNVVDGNSSTRWASSFSNNQELIIDLGQAENIAKVVINWEAASATYYKLQFSNNFADWSNPPSYVDAGADGGLDEIVQDFGMYRYMKIVLVERATQYGFSIFDVEVYKEIAAPHMTAQSLSLIKYDNTNGGRPLETCTEEIVGKVIVSRTGHYSHSDRMMVCLGASTPVTAMNYTWVIVGQGVSQ